MHRRQIAGIEGSKIFQPKFSSRFQPERSQRIVFVSVPNVKEGKIFWLDFDVDLVHKSDQIVVVHRNFDFVGFDQIAFKRLK